MKEKIAIIGSGGHCHSVINLLELNGFKIYGIFDDSYRAGMHEVISGYQICAKVKKVLLPKDSKIILAVGDNVNRDKLFNLFNKRLFKKNLIHPQAIIEKRTSLGTSNQIFARAYINSEAMLGNNNILNTGCVIEHESVIGDSNHVSVGAILCGRVTLADRCFIGAGAVVIDKIKICSDVIVGANSVVIKDIKKAGTYIGNPAKKIK
jgi:sugar O-acyltransferase (sialic acid O-acetyltransferase NeuD family)